MSKLSHRTITIVITDTWTIRWGDATVAAPATATTQSRQTQPMNKEGLMPIDKETLMHRFYVAFNARNLEALDEVMAADVVDHNPIPDQPAGIAGVKVALAGFFTAFSDIQIEVEQVLVAGDYVIVRQIARGDHDGNFLGIPATGNPVEIRSHDIARVENGLIVEVWHVEDLLNTLFQIGAFPPSSWQGT